MYYILYRVRSGNGWGGWCPTGERGSQSEMNLRVEGRNEHKWISKVEYCTVRG